MSFDIQKIQKNRTPILLAEIGAYLHVLGRFSKEFIYSHSMHASCQFNYQKILSDPSFFKNTGLDSILQDAGWKSLINDYKKGNNLGELSSEKVNSFKDFIEKHTRGDKPKGLCRILADAHGIVSGIDKALAGRSDSGKQATISRATAFGYETAIELYQNPQLKKELFQKLKTILEKIKKEQNISWENYSEFVSCIQEYYPKTIGETRRPIHEISLFDYAHAIASLMKSNLVKIIIDGWNDSIGQSKWRLLKVNIDITGLLEKGIKIGDILGYKKQITDVFQEIKNLIEYEYPLGNEIYQDSSGIYYTFPDFNGINEVKQEIIPKVESFDILEYSLQAEVSSSSRSMVILSKEIEKARKSNSYPSGPCIGIKDCDINTIEKTSIETDKEVCPVCRLGFKNKKQEQCQKCQERFSGRAKNWLMDPQQTIWLDEVADKNDRVALLVGHFDLRNWLSGNFIDTFLSQTFEEWKVNLSRPNRNYLEKNIRAGSIEKFEVFLTGLFNNNNNIKAKDIEILDKLIYITDDIKVDNNIDDSKFNINNHFWNPIAERDATGVASTLTTSAVKAKHIIKLLFRKHPSLSRISRIWRTTQEFITETIYQEILPNYSWDSGLRRQRIQFYIQKDNRKSFIKGASRDIDIEGLRLSPVCVDDTHHLFVTTCNLQQLHSKGKNLQEICNWLEGKEIKIKDEKTNQWLSGFAISNAREANPSFQNYIPYVDIYNFPDQFMALVPAIDAAKISQKIIEEYEKQFLKVRDRLPFHLGIIAFHKRTPLYIAMETGKSFIEQCKSKTQKVEAHVENIHPDQIQKKVTLNLNVGKYSAINLDWTFNYSTKDLNQDDIWHPYLRVQNADSKRTNHYIDYNGQGNFALHIKSLEEKDKIFIEPSFLKLLFLKKATDRFWIGNDLLPLDALKTLQKLWGNIQRISKEKKLSTSHLYAYWSEITKRRDDEQFIKSAIINMLQVTPTHDKEIYNALLEATKNGLLELCLHWNLQVKKIKPDD